MTDETRVIFEGLRRDADRRLWVLTREREYYVLVHLVTRRKRYYARLEDVRRVLGR
jgi:hypothetical protein